MSWKYKRLYKAYYVGKLLTCTLTFFFLHLHVLHLKYMKASLVRKLNLHAPNTIAKSSALSLKRAKTTTFIYLESNINLKYALQKQIKLFLLESLIYFAIQHKKLERKRERERSQQRFWIFRKINKAQIFWIVCYF